MWLSLQSSDCSEPIPEYEGYIDLGKELSLLHTLLTESLEKANEVNNSHNITVVNYSPCIICCDNRINIYILFYRANYILYN